MQLVQRWYPLLILLAVSNYKPQKLPRNQAAFSLLELIVVVIILSIVASYALTRFSDSNDYQIDTIAEQIISAGHLTQQLSMNDSSRIFSLSIETNQIDLRVDGVSFIATGTEFPLVFDDNLTLSPTSNIVFNSLGETTQLNLAIQLGNTVNICFESAGLIHRC